MLISIICRSNIEDKLVLNLINNNLKSHYKKPVDIDLILIGKEQNGIDSIFFENKDWRNLYYFEYSLKFFKSFKNSKYDLSIELNNSFKSYFTSFFIKSEKKISPNSTFRKILNYQIIDSKFYYNLKSKSEAFLKTIFDKKFDLNLALKIVDGENIKNNDLVKWIFETSSEQSFSKTNYIFIYFDYDKYCKSLVTKIVDQINKTFKYKIILTINSKNKNEGTKIYNNLDENTKKLVLKNFINCDNYPQIYLILKNCNWLITNNENLEFLHKNISNKRLFRVNDFKKKKKLSFFFKKMIYDESKLLIQLKSAIENMSVENN
tara:strand:+ start:1024 stop:1983 length:960 start_codon:yes stop_codon:yes gene_type:complete